MILGSAIPSAKAKPVHRSARETSRQRRDIFMGFSYFFFVAKLSPESDLLRPQGSGSEVSDFISAGQAHNEEKLEEIISTCKLLRTCGKPGVECANACNFPGGSPSHTTCKRCDSP